jgi:multiple sugar transport system ATP-binding protein
MSTDPNIALTIKNVSKSYGDLKVLHKIDLDQKDKEFLVLLGPSGCGKTTLLKILAGLLPADSGSVLLKGKDITNVPSYNRDIGMVFQNYALFPHMTVFQNVAFGLRMRKVAKGEISQRVESTLQLVRLAGMGNRSVKQLSGGQQQRVALARALVLNPSLLLLDEPLSNLDSKLRALVRVEITQIQRNLGLTAILVTHDQTEAMTMGDRIILMQDGVIQQSASPMEIYDIPNNVFVSSFIGSPQINLFNANLRDGLLQFLDFSCSIPREMVQQLICKDIRNGRIADGQYILGIRPEDFSIGLGGADHCLFEGKVIFIENLGMDQYLHISVGEKIIIVRNPHQDDRVNSVDTQVCLGFRPGKVHLFYGESQQRVTQL